jgi:hypothetical protein
MSETQGGRVERAANLFDLRRIIGGLFTIWGVLLIILGATDSTAEANKAAGININLYAGIGMLILGLVFVAWALTRPLGTEIAAEDAGAAEDSDEPGRGTRRDRDRAPGERDTGA